MRTIKCEDIALYCTNTPAIPEEDGMYSATVTLVSEENGDWHIESVVAGEEIPALGVEKGENIDPKKVDTDHIVYQISVSTDAEEQKEEGVVYLPDHSRFSVYHIEYREDTAYVETYIREPIPGDDTVYADSPAGYVEIRSDVEVSIRHDGTAIVLWDRYEPCPIY